MGGWVYLKYNRFSSDDSRFSVQGELNVVVLFHNGRAFVFLKMPKVKRYAQLVHDSCRRFSHRDKIATDFMFRDNLISNRITIVLR